MASATGATLSSRYPRAISIRRVSSAANVEIVQATRRERTEYHFRAPCHLLVLYEQGVRVAGETIIRDLPRSTLRDFKHKLTFVPAGHEYYESQDPRSRGRNTIMRRLITVFLALSYVAVATSGFARDGMPGGHGGVVRDPTILFGPPTPPVPSMGNRIPAPLPAPAQPPVINGPLSQPDFRGLTGIGE
jgi:hypothetical protein